MPHHHIHSYYHIRISSYRIPNGHHIMILFHTMSHYAIQYHILLITIDNHIIWSHHLISSYYLFQHMVSFITLSYRIIDLWCMIWYDIWFRLYHWFMMHDITDIWSVIYERIQYKYQITYLSYNISIIAMPYHIISCHQAYRIIF